MFVRFAVAIALICNAVFAADPAEDPAVALARILAAKGTISASELSSVEAASTNDRVAALAAILERKGVLSGAEVAQLRGPAIPVQTVAAVKPPPPPPPPQTRTSQTPEIPVRTHVGPAVSLYGTILFNAFYNTALNNIEDLPLLLTPRTAPSVGDKNFAMTARQTRLGLRLAQDNVVGAKLSGDFEFDLFAGKTPLTNGVDMDIFRLRLAYGRLDWKHVAFEAGQDWVIFAPLNPISYALYAIPEFSASGNLWNRLPQIRGEYKTGESDGNRFLWQVAAIDSNVGDYPVIPFSTSRQPLIGERGRMPALESRVAWSDRVKDHDLTIGLSGHYGRGQNFGVIDAINRFTPVDAWGVALDYIVPVTHFLNLTGEAFEGRALGIFSATAGEAVGAVGTPGEHGVESRGGWIQAQFSFAKRWQLNLGYGLEVPNASELPVGNHWRNQTYMGNVIYNLTRSVLFALEYRRMLTDFPNESFANARGDHINLAVGYIF
jgi:hypothetical protein